MGSMSSTGKMLYMEEIEEETLYEDYKQQDLVLEQGGVDIICLETMMDIEEDMIGVAALITSTVFRRSMLTKFSNYGLI